MSKEYDIPAMKDKVWNLKYHIMILEDMISKNLNVYVRVRFGVEASRVIKYELESGVDFYIGTDNIPFAFIIYRKLTALEVCRMLRCFWVGSDGRFKDERDYGGCIMSDDEQYELIDYVINANKRLERAS